MTLEERQQAIVQQCQDNGWTVTQFWWNSDPVVGVIGYGVGLEYKGQQFVLDKPGPDIPAKLVRVE